MEDIALIFFLICIPLFFVLAMVLSIPSLMKTRKEVQKRYYEDDSIEEETPAQESVELRVSVEDTFCCVKTVGVKSPKTVKEFTVVFKKEDGEFFSLSVPEEMYEGFEKGAVGLLTVVNGEVYGFEIDQ